MDRQKQNNNNINFVYKINIPKEIENIDQEQLYFDFILPAIKEAKEQIKTSLSKCGIEVDEEKNKIIPAKKYSLFHDPLASNMFLYPPMALYSKQPLKKSQYKPYIEYIGKDFKITVGSKKGVLNEFDEFVFKAGVLSFIQKVNDQVIACFTIPQLLKKLKMNNDGRTYKKICNALEKIEGMYMEHTKFMLFDGSIIKFPPQDLFVCRPMTISGIEDPKIIRELEKYDLEKLLSLKQQRPRLYLFIFDSPFKDRLLNEKWRFHDIKIYKKLRSPISRRLYELYLIAPKGGTRGKWLINVDELIKLIPIKNKHRWESILTLERNLKHLEKITKICGKIEGKNVVFYKKEKQTRIRPRKEKVIPAKVIKSEKTEEKDYYTKVIDRLLNLGYTPKEIDTVLNNPTINITNVYNIILGNKDLPKDELKNKIDDLFRKRFQDS